MQIMNQIKSQNTNKLGIISSVDTTILKQFRMVQDFYRPELVATSSRLSIASKAFHAFIHK